MRKHQILVVVFVLLFIAISIGVSQVSAATLLATIGADNALLLMFVLGMIGGFTTFSGIPYHLILMSLAAGGLSPVALGVVTAAGVMIGDSVMYGVSRQAATLLSARMRDRLMRLERALRAHPRLLTPFLMVYGLCSPFSNDFVVASLAAMGYRYHRIIIPLTLGNIGYNIALGYLGYYAYDWVVGVMG